MNVYWFLFWRKVESDQQDSVTRKDSMILRKSFKQTGHTSPSPPFVGDAGSPRAPGQPKIRNRTPCADENTTPAMFGPQM